MKVFNDNQEIRARLGMGSALYSNHFNKDGKFQFLIPTQETPFIGSEVGEVEIKVSCSSVVTKINGVETLNAAETGVYMHRDCIELLEELNGKTIELISMAGDFTGYRYSGSITYTPSNATMDDAWQGTIKITPKTKPEYVANCKPLLIPTVFFTTSIEPVVELDTTTGTFEQTIELSKEGATFKATSDSVETATVKVEGSKLTITGVKEGSTIIRLETSLEGHAPWKTTILVDVPKTL